MQSFNIMNTINSLFYVIVLVMSVVIHEVAHGLAAESQGDPTARYAGRLTLNPLSHIDPVGSVLLPLLLIVMHAGFVIGWARPVPYNERNLRNKKWGTILVASAGIVANLVLAIFFGLAIRFSWILGTHASPFVTIASVIVFVNLLLALFNLIPIPPLDGSKILFSLLPSSTRVAHIQSKIEYFSIVLLLGFLIFLWPLVVPVIGYLFGILTGMPIPVA